MPVPETPRSSDWFISARRRDLPEGILDRHPLPGATAAQLREALGPSYGEEDPDPAHSYPVRTHEQAARFERLLGTPVDIDSYDYFLDGAVTSNGHQEAPPLDASQVSWELLVFGKDEENAIAFEYELPRAPDAETRALLGAPVDETGYRTRWHIDRLEVANRLAPLLTAPLDLTPPYEYFLEYWDSSKTQPMVLAYSKAPQDEPRDAVALHPLHDLTKGELRSILGLQATAPMTGRHRVQTGAQAAALSRILGQPLELSTHDYFVDYYFPH
jgi:hypothetical protein